MSTTSEQAKPADQAKKDDKDKKEEVLVRILTYSGVHVYRLHIA